MMRIADRIAAYMRENNMESLGHGDGALSDAAAEHVNLGRSHPLNVMGAALDAMERTPDLFEKFYRRSSDCRGRQRLVRCFRLKTDGN